MKPTHEEIAKWLREASTKAALLKYYQDCSQEESLCEENVWLDRATLVESMPDLLKINKELVEALEAIMNVYGRSSRNPDEPGCIAKSRAALAKAKEGVE